MRSDSLADYLAPERVRLLRSTSREAALDTLAESLGAALPQVGSARIKQAVWEHEADLSTRLSDAVAMPHAQIEEAGRTLMAVGLSRKGIAYEANEAGPVHLVIMIVGPSREHLSVLNKVAGLLLQPRFVERALQCKNARALYRLFAGVSGKAAGGAARVSGRSLFLLRQMLGLAQRLGAHAVMVHGPAAMLRALPPLEYPGGRILLALTTPDTSGGESWPHPLLVSPFQVLNRWSQVEVTLLLALSRGLVRQYDKVLSVFPTADEHTLDAMVLTDMHAAFRPFLGLTMEGIEQQVLLRVLRIATELGQEGREGHPTGTLFVLGDESNVARHAQQMVINPFKGHPETTRNILDPGLTETIKEFSRIDGAFLLRGDGLILSAGAYLRVEAPLRDFPPGLGARHAAAAGVTAVTKAIAIALSESTGKTSVFRQGLRVMEL